LGIGDWGLGIGDWGLGPNPQSPNPIPQPPTNYQKNIKKIFNKLIRIYICFWELWIFFH
jgi:hypothetical protein